MKKLFTFLCAAVLATGSLFAQNEEVTGTPMHLSANWNASIELPAGEARVFTTTSQWASVGVAKNPISADLYKSVTIEFGEALPFYFNTPYKTADGGQQWGGVAQGDTKKVLDLAEVGSVTDFGIQNVQAAGTAVSFSVTKAYLTKADDTIEPVGFTLSGFGLATPLTAAKANFAGQWGSIQLNGAPSDEKDLTIRLYSNTPLPASIQYAVKWADDNSDGYPQIGKVNDYYAEVKLDRPISSIALQWTAAATGSVDIKAVTFEKPVPPAPRYVVVPAGAKFANPWDNQAWFVLGDFAEGDSFEFSCDVKADKAATVGTQLHGAPGSYIWHAALGNLSFTTEWTTVKSSGKFEKAGSSIALNLNDFEPANNYYFDNLSLKVNGVERIKNGSFDGFDTQSIMTKYNEGAIVEGKITMEKAPEAPKTLADGQYYFINYENDLFLEGNNSWGTQASTGSAASLFDVTKLENGNYSIANNLLTSSTKELNHELYLDKTTDASGWQISSDNSIYSTIYLDGYGYMAASKTLGANNLPIVEFVADVTDAAKWIIISKEAFQEAMKANDAAVNMTAYISNPDFSRMLNQSAWVVGEETTNKNLGGGANENFCAESWRSAFTISQTIEGLPNGTYQVDVQASCVEYEKTGLDLPVVFANDATSTFVISSQESTMENGENSMTMMSASFTQGLYRVQPIIVEVKDGKLTIGVKGTRTDTWCIWDNFRLTKLATESGDAKPQAPALPAVKTTALATDGTAQYFYNVEAQAFLTGGNDWGTRASVDTGKANLCKFTADGDAYKFEDQHNGNWNGLDFDGGSSWVDGAGRAGANTWAFEVAADGTFTITNSVVAGKFGIDPSKNDTRLYFCEGADAKVKWAAVSEADYAAYQEAYKSYAEKYAEYQKALDEYNKTHYNVGDDITALAPSTWDGQTGGFGGVGGSSERYSGAGSIEEGDVMTQTLTGLKNGTYEVTLVLAASYTSGRGFECPTGDGLAVAFAGDKEENLPVVDRTWVTEPEANTITFKVTVKDGTLKYGIKNVAPAANWYVALVKSIKYVSEAIASSTMGAIITDIDAVETTKTVNGKMIENGSIVIVKNGVKYNVNGSRIK